MISDKYKNIYLDWLLNDKNDYMNNNVLKLSIIKNKNTPIDILLNIYGDVRNHSEDLFNSIENKLLILEDLIVLKKVLENYNKINFMLVAISKNPNIDEEIVDFIFKNNDKHLIINLVENDKLPLEKIIQMNQTLAYGLKDVTYNYLQSYILNITSPIELEKLMHYTNKDLNYIISHSKYLTDDLFNLLSLSNDFRTRSVLASRIDTPIEVLYSFIDDESDSVRLSLAKNINIDKKILLSLSFDEKITIIKEVIKHNNTDKFILNSIMDSKSILDDGIKNLVKEQIEKLDNLFLDNNSDYYDTLEELELGEIEEIEVLEKINLNENRKKIIIELAEDL
jgi:hypothetical protein